MDIIMPETGDGQSRDECEFYVSPFACYWAPSGIAADKEAMCPRCIARISLSDAEKEWLHSVYLCDCDDLLGCKTLRGLYFDVATIKLEAIRQGRAEQYRAQVIR